MLRIDEKVIYFIYSGTIELVVDIWTLGRKNEWRHGKIKYERNPKCWWSYEEINEFKLSVFGLVQGSWLFTYKNWGLSRW